MKTDNLKRKYSSIIVIALLFALCLSFTFHIFSVYSEKIFCPDMEGVFISKGISLNIAFNGEEIVIAGMLSSSVFSCTREFFRYGINRKYYTYKVKDANNNIQSYIGMSGCNINKKPIQVGVSFPLRFCHTESSTEDTEPS